MARHSLRKRGVSVAGNPPPSRKASKMFARKSALVIALVVAATTVVIASASAQVGPNNPSGGTSLRQTTEEGIGTFGSAGFLFRALSIGYGWQPWLGTFATSRQSATLAPRPTGIRSLLAVARRQSWSR